MKLVEDAAKFLGDARFDAYAFASDGGALRWVASGDWPVARGAKRHGAFKMVRSVKRACS